MTVMLLGATGMLGNAVLREFESFSGGLIATSRTGKIEGLSKAVTQVAFDAKSGDLGFLLGDMQKGDYLINCIGVIKSEIDEASTESKDNATAINAVFPQNLAEVSESKGLRIIQIATDCAFSGKTGHYSESSHHDAEDHYGLTKSAGEVVSDSMMHLRVSIIGPETRGHKSLYDWVALQPFGAKITGYTNHLWNGIPAKHFARISRAIIESDLFVPGTQHIIPKDEVTKAQLVRLIAAHTVRQDLTIADGMASEAIDRTLTTNNPGFNSRLWQAAGYLQPPTIAELVAEI